MPGNKRRSKSVKERNARIDREDKNRSFLTKSARNTKLGTGGAEKARKALKGRLSEIERKLKEAGAR